MSAVCGSCGAPVVWAITRKGKRIPFDPEPKAVLNGFRLNMTLDPPSADYVSYGDAQGELLYVSHFATCPHAGLWRKEPR